MNKKLSMKKDINERNGCEEEIECFIEEKKEIECE